MAGRRRSSVPWCVNNGTFLFILASHPTLVPSFTLPSCPSLRGPRAPSRLRPAASHDPPSTLRFTSLPQPPRSARYSVSGLPAPTVTVRSVAHRLTVTRLIQSQFGGLHKPSASRPPSFRLCLSDDHPSPSSHPARPLRTQPVLYAPSPSSSHPARPPRTQPILPRHGCHVYACTVNFITRIVPELTTSKCATPAETHSSQCWPSECWSVSHDATYQEWPAG